jgi:hypothetical protein
MAWDSKKYYNNRYKNDPKYRKKCIEASMKWQRENKDKFKVIVKRYYNSHSKDICKKVKRWHNSEIGKEWYKKYYGSKNHIKSLRKYYNNNVMKWDRYRYKWILNGLDIHDKNYRVANLFIKRINKISNYRIDKEHDIKMKSNGKADIKIKVPSKVDVNNVKNLSVYWADNFNKHCGTKVKLGIKTYGDIKSSYKMMVTIGE